MPQSYCMDPFIISIKKKFWAFILFIIVPLCFPVSYNIAASFLFTIGGGTNFEIVGA